MMLADNGLYTELHLLSHVQDAPKGGFMYGSRQIEYKKTELEARENQKPPSQQLIPQNFYNFHIMQW